jgi:hypothetical protein
VFKASEGSQSHGGMGIFGAQIYTTSATIKYNNSTSFIYNMELTKILLDTGQIVCKYGREILGK